MIETIFQDYLIEQLAGVPILLEEPENPPDRYVVLQKTGSAHENQIHTATFAVRSYGPSLYAAAALNCDVIQAALGMRPNNGVFCAELNSDYEYTNIQTKQYRYQAVLVIYY